MEAPLTCAMCDKPPKHIRCPSNHEWTSCAEHWTSCFACEPASPPDENENTSDRKKPGNNDRYESDTEVDNGEMATSSPLLQTAWHIHQSTSAQLSLLPPWIRACSIGKSSTITNTESKPALIDLFRWANDTKEWISMNDSINWIVNMPPTTDLYFTSVKAPSGPFVVLGARLNTKKKGVIVTFELKLHRVNPHGEVGGMAIHYTRTLDDEIIQALDQDSHECEEIRPNKGPLTVLTDDDGIAKVTLRLPYRCRYAYTVSASYDESTVQTEKIWVWQQVDLNVYYMKAIAKYLEKYGSGPCRLSRECFGDSLNPL